MSFRRLIEHTNFIPESDYGEDLMYVTSYFQNPESVLWKKSNDEVVEIYLKGLENYFLDFGKMLNGGACEGMWILRLCMKWGTGRSCSYKTI